jgi:nucleoside-diphosphate-sugar epimerase
MARSLIVGCGCRGQSLARALRADGLEVRGTSRSGNRLPHIENAGAEAVLADPFRLATVTPLLAGVSVVVWPLGSATGTPEEVEAVHGPRLETLLTKLVDSGVRGLVYEAAGSVRGDLLRAGAARCAAAAEWFRMPVEVVEHDPGDHAGWTGAMRAGVGRVLAA